MKKMLLILVAMCLTTTANATAKMETISPKKGSVIYFDAPVVPETVDAAIELLTEATSKFDEVYLVISSPGGSVFDGNRLIAFVESTNKVNTVCLSICASMAAHLHQAGKTRLMVPGAVLMFHPVSAGVQGSLYQMKSRLKMIEQEAAQMDSKICARSGIPFGVFEEKMSNEYWVLSEEAVETHLVEKLAWINTGDPKNPSGSSVLALAIKRAKEEQKTEGEDTNSTYHDGQFKSVFPIELIN